MQIRLQEARILPDWVLGLMAIGVLTLLAINYTVFAFCVICHCGHTGLCPFVCISRRYAYKRLGSQARAEEEEQRDSERSLVPKESSTDATLFK